MGFFQILVVASPGPYAQMFFVFFLKKKNFFFLDFLGFFLLTWDPWEPKRQNATPPSNHFLILFLTFSEFSSQ